MGHISSVLRTSRIISLGAIMMLAVGGTVRGQTAGAATSSMRGDVLVSFQDSVMEVLTTRQHPMMRWSRLSDVAASVRRLYAENNWNPLWSAQGQPTPLAETVARVLQDATERGLASTDYDATYLSAPPHADAWWDVAMTADVLRFASALRFGRIDAASVYTGLHLPRDTVDLAAFVHVLRNAAIATYTSDTTMLDSWARAQFDTLEPPWSHYWLLRNTLHTYHNYATGVDPLPPEVTPGLVAARIPQIELALERWRWLPQAFRTAPIFVNIPAFRLYAFSSPFDDAPSTLLNMDVAVGKAFKTRTPVFSALLTTVIFSPYWDIPPSIASKEILPKARRNLGYLARSHMEIVSVPEDRILPLTAGSLARVSNGSARIRQRPGPDNALGGVKFVFPNEYNVYLHDTPMQSVFQQARRDVSHGCIRVAEPARLAAFVLRDQPQWTPDAVLVAMHKTTPQRVSVTNPIPVFVMYTTVITRADGETLFYDDLYGHDRLLTARLAHGYPYTHE